MHIAVCDDNKLFLRDFEEQLRDIEFVDTIHTFFEYNAFLFSIDSGRQYDAVFMDIDWNRELNGMDIAEELYKICPSTKVIYVTGYSERYSQNIFLHKANLSGFLTKPIDRKLLYANLQKIIQSIPTEEHPVLLLSQQGTPVPVLMREILFIESQGHRVMVHTSEETIISYCKLAKIMQTLPSSFYQCHKSYIVNMAQIRRFQAAAVLLKNGTLVPVSRARHTKTKEAFFRYMGMSF